MADASQSEEPILARRPTPTRLRPVARSPPKVPNPVHSGQGAAAESEDSPAAPSADLDLPPPPLAAPSLTRAFTDPTGAGNKTQFSALPSTARRVPPRRLLRAALEASPSGGDGNAIRSVLRNTPAAGGHDNQGFLRFKEHLRTLRELGFEADAAEHALFATSNRSVEEAVEHLLRLTTIAEETKEEPDADLLGEPPAPLALQHAMTDPTGVRQPTRRAPTKAELLALMQPPSTSSSSSASQQASIDPLPAAIAETPAPAWALPDVAGQHVVTDEPVVQQATANCGVCWDPLVLEPGAAGEPPRSVVLKCGHRFCCECAAGWLNSLITEGKVQGAALMCPMVKAGACASTKELPPAEVEQLLVQCTPELLQLEKAMGGSGDVSADTKAPDEILLSEDVAPPEPQLLAKFRRFKLNAEIDNDPHAFWCPNPGCETPIRVGMFHVGRRAVCSKCSTAMCSSCGRKYHGMIGSCAAATDAALAEYAQSKHLQPCPGCRRQVEKRDACPHMTCVCGHQWCWVCRANYPCSQLHFGVQGSGSGADIGDVLWVQRILAVLRVVSAATCLPFTGLVIALAALTWALFVVCLALGLLASVLTLPVRLAMNKDAKLLLSGVDKVFGNIADDLCECEFDLEPASIVKLPIYFVGGCCVCALFLCALGLATAICLLAVVPAVLYLLLCLVNRVVKGHWTLQLTFSAMNEYEFPDDFKENLLVPVEAVQVGRASLAMSIFGLTAIPLFALGLALLPASFIFILPLTCNPRGTMPFRVTLPIVLGASAGSTFLAYALWLNDHLSGTWEILALAGVAVAALLLFRSWLCFPPSSACASFTPFWVLSYSLPVLLVNGRDESREFLAFSPVPDLPMQAPLGLCSVIDDGCECCNGFLASICCVDVECTCKCWEWYIPGVCDCADLVRCCRTGEPALEQV